MNCQTAQVAAVAISAKPRKIPIIGTFLLCDFMTLASQNFVIAANWF
jgi:hypothetical protein